MVIIPLTVFALMMGKIEFDQSDGLGKVDGHYLLFTVSFSAIATCIAISNIDIPKPGVVISIDKEAFAVNAVD